MQRHHPRRTSELPEEPGTATKRQTRNSRRCGSSVDTTPATGVGTAQKGRQWASSAGSASRPRYLVPTPQKTPSNSARALFTAEKQRVAKNVALHNDKKWVEEQTQRITDYLKKAWKPNCMPGINEDFFARSNCLKQMSIKQFVSIFNYFLQFIWGIKFTVGTNHVDDIVQILQKLNYPHQVNKSWLKTPNTTHAFGNVIVIFDFLMDFAPKSPLEFEINEPQETTPGNDEVEPDLEFKTNLLNNCAESFYFWDKQLDEEYQKIKRHTADLLVRKSCEAADLDDLDIQLDNMYQELETLKRQRPHIAPEDEHEYDRLKKFHHNIGKEIEQLHENQKKLEVQLEQISIAKQHCLVEISRLEQEIVAHQKSVRNQICTVEQRDAYLEKLNVKRTELQCHERTIADLKERDIRQQVRLSNAKKNLTDQIEQLNAVLRNINSTFAKRQLQLPLNADFRIVEKMMPALSALRNEFSNEIKKTKLTIDQNETDMKKLNHEFTLINEPRKNALESTLASFLKMQEKIDQPLIEEREKLLVKLEKLKLELSQVETETEDHKNQLHNTQKECEQIEEECEEIISVTEKLHAEAVESRMKILDDVEKMQNDLTNRLHEIEEIVYCNKENQITLPKEE